ncbi:MAG: peptide chain release factor N(5)-glutamine methyltransferase [Colwellia sp.]|nr:peptide chain release factor N(5)-glutamine methyltransferase [Colwellia sp.]MCW9082835.1 peptide chain release factor N(5)-glutamine methyltransferase [Colwellia sp.]
MTTAMRMRFVGDNSIANLLNQGLRILQESSDSPLLDAQVLLTFVLNKPRTYLLTWPEKHVSNELLEQYVDLLVRRSLGEPVAYITSEKEFWSLPFKVSPVTLIPRPDTEILVERVLEQYNQSDNISCLDLGTGTGAIALALASEKASWAIDAVDFNVDAVTLAQHNAKRLKLTQVNIFQSDWFTQVSADKKFDVIVSNPPYIDDEDENLSHGDVRFEPKSALVADEQGLADIRHIANVAREYLAKQGKIFFEHGFEQGAAVRTLLAALGYENVQTGQDLNGHERITWAVFP